MQDQPNRTADELLRDVWAHLDAVVANQGHTEFEIGINIGRPKDNLDELGKFSLMLAAAYNDASYSNATLGVLGVESGYLLATTNPTCAKRLFGLLISQGFALREADILLVNDSAAPERKEIAVPSFEMN